MRLRNCLTSRTIADLIKCKPRSALLNRKSRLNAPNAAEHVLFRSCACRRRNVRIKHLAIAFVAASTTSPCNFRSLALEASSHLRLDRTGSWTHTYQFNTFVPAQKSSLDICQSASVGRQKTTVLRRSILSTFSTTWP